MKKRITAAIIAVVVLIAVIIFFSSLYTVSEMEYVVVTQFGKPVRIVTKAGLYSKNPITQTANSIEKRILSWDGDPNTILTEDKKTVDIDTWARWRITQPEQFYVSLQGRIPNGQKKLDDIVDGVVRDTIAKYTLNELVRSTNRKLTYQEELDYEDGERDAPLEVKVGREKVELEILTRASKGLEANFGIELLDVRIKRVNYTTEVRTSLYARMKTERDRISSRFLSEAKGQGDVIRGDMRMELAVIEGEAAKESAEIRGEADALAIKIYADAIRKAPEFYEFLRTLEAYEKIFDENTKIILSTDSRLMRLLKGDTDEE